MFFFLKHKITNFWELLFEKFKLLLYIFEKKIKRIMSAITIQAITILENKEDDTLMAKEEFFKMIDEARASKKTKASKQELINMLYK